MHTSYFKKLTKTVSVVALAAAVGFGTTYASVRSLLADADSAGNTVNGYATPTRPISSTFR